MPKVTEVRPEASIIESGKVKFFDFSNTNKLFLGGAVGYAATRKKVEYNGAMNFQGAYKGKVVFDNISAVIGWDGMEIIMITRSGSFYVESNGDKINLPQSEDWAFLHPYSKKDIDYIVR